MLIVVCFYVQSLLSIDGLFGLDIYIICILLNIVKIWVPHLHKNLNICKTTCWILLPIESDLGPAYLDTSGDVGQDQPLFWICIQGQPDILKSSLFLSYLINIHEGRMVPPVMNNGTKVLPWNTLWAPEQKCFWSH